MAPPPPPPVPAVSSDKTIAILCHVAPFIGVPFLLPFVVYLIKRDESPYVAAHAKEAFNFHLSILLYCLCLFPLIVLSCGILFYPVALIYAAAGLLTAICAVVAAIKTSDNGFFHYPLTIHFV